MASRGQRAAGLGGGLQGRGKGRWGEGEGEVRGRGGALMGLGRLASSPPEAHRRPLARGLALGRRYYGSSAVG